MSQRIMFSWSHALVLAIESYGLSSAELFAESGVAPAPHISPFHRIEVGRLRGLFDRVIALSGDPAFVLRLVEFVSPTTLHALGLALFACRDLHGFFSKLSRFSRLLTDQDGNLEIQAGETLFTLRLTTPERDAVPELVHLTAATLLRFVRMVARPDYAFHAVSFRDVFDTTTEERFRAHFGCPLHCSADADLIVVTRADMYRPLSGGCEEIEALQDSIVVEQISRLESANLGIQVQSQILMQLGETAPSMNQVARALGLSSRAMQARLQQEGTTFQEMLDAARRSLAAQYLAQPDLSVGEIAYRLGYRDSSSFCRAYKRWTGKSPRD